MLFRELLIQEFNAKREDFKRFADKQADELESYLNLLREIGGQTSAEIRARFGRNLEVGAMPSGELEKFQGVVVSFEPRWTNHEEARAWAVRVLENRTTFAADASQILPGREISLPVAAIQVGTFENAHTAGGDYKKQAHLQIIAPDEFYESDLLDEKPVSAETLVGFLRFQAEIEQIKKFLKSKAGWQSRGERAPLAFLDGTLLPSISQPQTKLQNRFLAATAELVHLSQAAQVPLVGFVDQSYARDVVTMLDEYGSRFSRNRLHVPSARLSDATIFHGRILKNWGERTTFLECRRKGLSDFFVDDEENALCGLVYLQTTGNAIPARLDIPAWIYAENLLEEVLDTVRAECVIGLGYPYALETADAAAVITSRDRETFLRALQEFSARENLNFRVSNKTISKARRR